MTALPNESILIDKAIQGHLPAFEELVKQYERRVLSLAYQLVGNTHDAEDIYQEVFLRVYKNIHRFRKESDFYTWLYRIVVNCSITYRKKRNRRAMASIDEMQNREESNWMPRDEDPTPDTLTLSKEAQQQIETHLDQLPLMQRTVFVLKFFQDFKIREIAEIIGASEGTVKNYIFRGTRKMRHALKPYMENRS